jgi:hypothetical protein
MRRLWIALLAISVTLVLALPAGAAPPCSVNPNHPNCIPDEPVDPPPGEDGPMAGTTCADAGLWGQPVTQDFEITLAGPNDSYCVDVIAGPGQWNVDVAIDTGSVRMLLFIPRESIAAGDSCGGYGFRSNNVPSSFSGEIPDSYVNSCGVDFAEWVDVQNDQGEHELTYFDTVEPEIESPLAFQIDVAGSKDLEMTLTVDLPGVDNEPVDVTPPDPTP